MLTTDQKGAIAEAKIAAAALVAGVTVSRPLVDERYDLIFDVGGKLLRVQCKWAVRTGDVVEIRCRRVRRARSGLLHRSYLPGEIDAIAAYCPETEECYLLPTELSVARAAVRLRVGPTRNNQANGIRWAKEYELGATLPQIALGP